MNTPLCALSFLLLLNSVLADPAVIIRERAKQLRDANNAEQGVVTPTPQPATPAVAPSGPPPTTLSPSLVRFNTQINSIKADATVSTEQNQKLAQELINAAQGSKPSLKTASKLATDLSAALSEKPLSPAVRGRLLQELDAVLNPNKYPQARVEGIIKDVQTIFQENGLGRIRAMMIADDVKAVADEVRR